jgi:hypothetical protein
VGGVAWLQAAIILGLDDELALARGVAGLAGGKGPSKKATGLDVYLIKFRGTNQPNFFFLEISREGSSKKP